MGGGALEFIKEWIRLLFKGDDIRDATGRLIGALLVGAGIGLLQDSAFLYLTLPIGTYHVTLTIGWLTSIVVVSIYAVFMAGIAWIRSRGPILWMASRLEFSANSTIRLRIRNLGGGLSIRRLMC